MESVPPNFSNEVVVMSCLGLSDSANTSGIAGPSFSSHVDWHSTSRTSSILYRGTRESERFHLLPSCATRLSKSSTWSHMCCLCCCPIPVMMVELNGECPGITMTSPLHASIQLAAPDKKLREVVIEKLDGPLASSQSQLHHRAIAEFVT